MSNGLFGKKKYTQPEKKLGAILKGLPDNPLDLRTSNIHPSKEYINLMKEKIRTFDWGFDLSTDVSDPAPGHLNLRRMQANCMNLLMGIVKAMNPFWLTMIGRSGTGKTMLANKVLEFAKQHLKLQITKPYYINWNVLYNKMKQEDAWDLPYMYSKECDLLVVDDICNKGAGVFSSDELASMAEMRKCRWTIWTSNLSLDEIDNKIDPRITSRMKRDGSIVVVLDERIPDYNG